MIIKTAKSIKKADDLVKEVAINEIKVSARQFREGILVALIMAVVLIIVSPNYLSLPLWLAVVLLYSWYKELTQIKKIDKIFKKE